MDTRDLIIEYLESHGVKVKAAVALGNRRASWQVDDRKYVMIGSTLVLQLNSNRSFLVEPESEDSWRKFGEFVFFAP